MENNKKFYSTRKLIKSVEVSEIDFELDKELGFSYDEFEEHIEIKIGHSDSDSEPIQIDWLMKILNDLKSNGSTHVSLDYHIDHIGYLIDGFEIKKSNALEIEAYRLANEIKKEKQAKINSLRKELRNLEGNY